MSQLFEIGAHIPATLVANEATTLGGLFRARARTTPRKTSHFSKTGGEWKRATWSEFYDEARRVASGLARLDVTAGERVSILGPTAPAWGRYDLGAQLLGLVTVGIYPHQSPEQVRYLLEHSESRVVFVSGEEEMETVLSAAKNNQQLQAIVPWQEDLGKKYASMDERIVSPSAFEGEPMSHEEIEERLNPLDPEETAILVYTSGTTGPPKGAMLTHANILALVAQQDRFFPYYDDDVNLVFLPMAHVAERVLSFYGRVNTGMAVAYASSMAALLEELKEVRPTIFGSVPRIFEKVHAKIHGEIQRKPAVVQKLFQWADQVGRKRVRLELAGKKVPLGLELQYKLASRLVFQKIRDAFGGRVRGFITGAAPIALDILEFFWSAGLPVYEVYGMTEATVVTHVNRPGAVKLGSVGQVVEPMECRIAEDGEILLRGPFVFKGYFKNEEATRETIVGEWLHTGDIGQIDADGYLRITDRKKHLIITAGGKNVAPANIERAIKAQSPLISQVHAHGDRRPYVVAILAPSPLETLEWGVKHSLVSAAELQERQRELQANPSARSEALARAMAGVTQDRRFQEAFLEPVRRGNRDLARVEQVRRFVVLERDFSQEEGELTPTMKLRRRAIEQKFSDLFDRIYDEEGFAINAMPH